MLAKVYSTGSSLMPQTRTAWSFSKGKVAAPSATWHAKGPPQHVQQGPVAERRADAGPCQDGRRQHPDRVGYPGHTADAAREDEGGAGPIRALSRRGRLPGAGGRAVPRDVSRLLAGAWHCRSRPARR